VNYLSPAKVNLSLKVGERLDDGYHPVDTVIHLLDFGDTISIEDADRLALTCSVDLGITEEENIAFQAAQRIGEAFEHDTPFSIHLEKRIPHGAGLGGGSSNAATVLRALADRWKIPLDDARLREVARSLGADVMAFLAPSTCTYLTGRGDIVKESLNPLTGLPIVLIQVPGSHASTAQVYRVFDQIGPTNANPVLTNDLEQAAIAVCPQTGIALEWLRTHPQTDGAQVCGSGSACFGLVRSQQAAEELARGASDEGFWSVAATMR